MIAEGSSFADSVVPMLLAVSVWAVPVLLAVTLHEVAHGWVAWKLGDDTARKLGRISFNPLKHIDPVGTLALPALLLFASGGRMMFGYARPVPVNIGRLGSPRRDMVLVAVAGPATNLVLAFVSALLFHALPLVPDWAHEWVRHNLFNSIWLNLLLCVFNMLPMPPLDGGRVAVGLLPERLAIPLAWLERAGIFIVLGAMFILPWIGGKLGVDLNVFVWLVGRPAEYLLQIIATVTGIR
ncbi:MAG: site-2 protease family protein [Rhodospirillales bacterium]|jgi:Zn-dependent protease|nr:site-2 protease family protein [Rhodospirillales bacterium]